MNTTDERAWRAYEILRQYRDGDWAEAVEDLLTDLMHFGRRFTKVNAKFDERLINARHQFNREVREAALVRPLPPK